MFRIHGFMYQSSPFAGLADRRNLIDLWDKDFQGQKKGGGGVGKRKKKKKKNDL